MSGLFKKSTKKEILVVGLFYIIIVYVGIYIYKDFGISVDEWELRIFGFTNLSYILSLIDYNSLDKLNQILETPPINDYNGTHGVIFSLPAAFLEYFLNIKDSQSYYYLRHYLNHLLFIIGNFYFIF